MKYSYCHTAKAKKKEVPMMKKLFLIAALMFASFGAFADDFDDLVAINRRAAAKVGWGFRADYERRLLCFDIKFSEDVKAFTRRELEDFKREFILSFRKNADPEIVDRMRMAKVTMVIHLVMADGYKFKVSIPWYEL